MRELSLVISNYIVFILICFLLTGIQTSLWLQLFGYFPGPILWIPVLNYWAFNRSPMEAIIMSYLIVFILSTMTGMPLGIIFISVLACYGIIFLLKDRVLWSGPSHFTLSTAITGYSLPIIILVTSWSLENQPVTDFQFFNWILSPLLTALFSLFLYPVFIIFDRLTAKGAPRDNESEVL